nr:hypothetical protein [Tanacetum cinerariifolium]
MFYNFFEPSTLENHQENTFYHFFKPTTLENIGPSNNITNTSFHNNGLDLNIGTSDFHNNESNHQNESHFEKPECSFAFEDYHKYKDEKNDFDDVVDDNPLPNYQKWQKYISFKPDIPETPLYKSKPMISKHYKKKQTLRSAPEGDNPSLLFISDRHAAIALAVQNKFPLAYHADIQSDVYDKLCQVGPQIWSRAHCPLVRYNYLTSNSVESVNACTVVYRKLPVIKLAETYRAMVQDWYYKRRKLAGTCQYRKWQLSGLLCGHVIAVTKYLGLTDCLQFVSDWFKKLKYQGTYAEPIHFIRNVQEWEFPQHIWKVIPPGMEYPQSGRPKNTNRIKSQGEEPRVIHCSLVPPRRRFVGGLVATVDPVELERFSTNQVKRILKYSFGYDENSSTFLYLKKPNCSLDIGLIPSADALQDRNMSLTNTEDVRLNVLMKLQEALDEEAILEEQILTLMHHFSDRFTDRMVENNNLIVLHDHPLIDYGKFALGCMTWADMKKCVHLKSIEMSC